VGLGNLSSGAVGTAARGASRRPGTAPRDQVSRSEALDAIVVTMYTYTVERTQIYLTPEESAALERESIKTGKTKSQLIREAIDEKYGTRASLEAFMSALHAVAGIWKDRPEGDPAEYIEAGRRIEQERLERLLGNADAGAQ
jgi:predicted DNA-binding protein